MCVASRFVNLKYLQINLQNCYCPWGCHRVLEEAIECTGSEDWTMSQILLDMEPAVLDIVVTLSKQERQCIRHYLEERTFELQFHGGWTKAEDEQGFAIWDEKLEVVDGDGDSEDSEGMSVDESDDEDQSEDEGSDDEDGVADDVEE